MEDDKRLIESYKTNSYGTQVLDWKSIVVMFFSRFRNQLLMGMSILMVTLSLCVIFSIIFTGGSWCSLDEGWSKFEGHCYKLVTDFHDMRDCRQECIRQGGDLASIHNERENDFITKFIENRPTRGGEKDTWIAGQIEESYGEFTWMDGTKWDFDNWDQGEPDKKSFGREHHECVFLGKNLLNLGKWWDGVCSWKNWSFDCVCKK